MNTACIVLAAGNSRRMNSDTLKILHNLSGLSVIGHVLGTLEQLNLQKIVIVASPTMPDHPDYKGHLAIVQDKPLGTAHAAGVGLNGILQNATLPEYVMIICGDTPLITVKTLSSLMESKADFTMLKAHLPLDQQHSPYGRIVFDAAKCPSRIVEYKDATEIERTIPWINTGIYKIRFSLLQELLPQITNINEAGEYYLTDILELCTKHDATRRAIAVDFEETLGVNTRAELEQADAIIQERLKENLRAQGVTFQNAHSTRVCMDTSIGRDSVIEPHVTFSPKVTVGPKTTIKSFSYLTNCTIGADVHIGPFAHIRGGSVMHDASEIGNFVELKATTMHSKAKAKHLTYLGDAIVGAKANIGAGTITANYDGFFKHKTTIGENTHIGANTVLVAPITVGDGTITAAGSTITENVPADSLVISRMRQIVKASWAATYRAKMTEKKNQK